MYWAIGIGCVTRLKIVRATKLHGCDETGDRDSAQRRMTYLMDDKARGSVGVGEVMKGVSMKTGIYEDLPAWEYHADPALGSSFLKNMAAYTPLHAKEYAMRPESSPAMTLGSALHCNLLEPNEFERRYIVKPEDMTFVSKAGKEWRNDARARGLEILTQEQFGAVKGMTLSVLKHRKAGMLLAGDGKSELSLFWERDGISCKARLDRWQAGIVLDLKSCADARRFDNTIFASNYHIQQAWYESGIRFLGMDCTDFLFVAVESAPPFACRVMRAPAFGQFLAAEKITELLTTYKQCMKSGVWPGYSDDIEDAALPGWVEADQMEDVA